MTDTTRNALVVDDDATNQLMLSMLLRKLGYQCLSASDVPQACQILRETSCDLLLTDLALANGSGLEVVTWLRSQTDNPNRHVPIIVVSGYAGPDHDARCLAAGATATLAKPVRLADLEKTLDTHPPATGNSPGRRPPAPPTANGDDSLWRETRHRIHHDLMNVLIKARGAAMLSPDRPLEATRERVDEAIAILSAFRDLTALAEGDVATIIEPLDLAREVDAVLADMPAARRPAVDPALASTTVETDRELFRELLRSLLDRALAQGGEVTIATGMAGEKVELTITATRPFLPPAPALSVSFPTHNGSLVEPDLVKCHLIARVLGVALRAEQDNARCIVTLAKSP